MLGIVGFATEVEIITLPPHPYTAVKTLRVLGVKSGGLIPNCEMPILMKLALLLVQLFVSLPVLESGKKP